ncbi:similar to Saccharomyces cerevisiae YJL133W MRS3 Iron transporter that mediates Fe2+ transport across the inner mitochondrial membrane [Maudiozyma barnettii]|uniref:Similar to Saccharomyces cerevisiae YJL133W MRS3 Iron transporter that mediates Fe2+ transport across the inner mitochondrial membrane n=1 Tax=Maudiozyma barnettii TaxID=61262 RepID=A0A8H2ZJV9_9SACH|nr:uncharacterized protein KABA2_04S10010 [Kazachstania barnettii]CAB4254602.1 similar to Saccharomyces cerevisiae YJL133W MRS3 Iron transporter that mediates Fe2+ transport across the inner mitochondrial membrane [Kazachstania barnettii]CAD1782644.1 similar to Saccharomyces cerevisiae YJL133W MRS3 Iron transporter that mediates Fe2+ transport across the inner mitochondrial membrane [Kazachstania barnettii]
MSLKEISRPDIIMAGGEEEEVDYEALPSNAPLSHQLLAGAFAGIMEHSVLYPIDAIKTRIQSATLSNGSDNILRQISRISTTEGSLALWKGVQSVILGAGPAHAVYFATYEYSKSHLIDPKDINTHQPLKTAASGALATIAADALMNPFDTIKQRIQLNTNSSVWNLTKNIYSAEGISAFYVSYPTTLAMNIPFAAFNFMIYESATKFFNPGNNYNPLIHCLCGGISGAACAAITTPLDCIKTVLQVKGSKSVQLNVMKTADTFGKASAALYSTYGWKGFWRGLKPRVIANMPATAISWTAYECAKHFLIK